MTIYDRRRADWGAKPARYTNPLDWKRVTDVIVHYPASGNITIGTDEAQIARRLRGWQTYHMTPDNPATKVKEGQGWSDIAYSVAVDQAGRVWELRGLDRREGATTGWGGRSVSILIAVGDSEPLSDELKRSVLRVMAECDRRKGRKLKRGWHSQYQQTSCPGQPAIAWGRAGFPPPRLIPATPTPVQEDIMATKDELRQIIREELHALMAGTIPVSAGTDRPWTTTRDAALAEAAELGKVRLPDGTVVRTDDVLGELAQLLAEVKGAGEDEIRKTMGV